MKPKRKDYRLGRLMQGQGQHGIMLDMLDWEEDAGTGGGDTDPQRFPAVDYWKVQETEK